VRWGWEISRGNAPTTARDLLLCAQAGAERGLHFVAGRAFEFRNHLLDRRPDPAWRHERDFVRAGAERAATRQRDNGTATADERRCFMAAYFSCWNDASSCWNFCAFPATVLAGPVNLMNTFPPRPSTMAPSRR